MSPCSWDIAVPGAPVGHSGLALKSDKTEESFRNIVRHDSLADGSST
jgi:hypothetical protein